MSTLEMLGEKIEALEREVEALKKRPAPRGPAGDISAAVAQAAATVGDAEARVQAKADAAHRTLEAEVKAIRAEVKQLRQHLDDRIKVAAENNMIQVLRDYGLLDENHAPSHWTKK